MGSKEQAYKPAGHLTINGWAWINGKWKTGVRYIYEKADEQRINGTKYDAESGALTEDETHFGQCLECIFDTKYPDTPKLYPSRRTEIFEYERQIFRRTFRVGSQNNQGYLLSQWEDRTKLISAAVITGFSSKRLFGGAPQGLCPTAHQRWDFIYGFVYELEAEQSVNSELGF